jgi:hypothetical protein
MWSSSVLTVAEAANETPSLAVAADTSGKDSSSIDPIVDLHQNFFDRRQRIGGFRLKLS